MNKIQKVIPLETFKSRLSSIVPAYDMSGTCHYFEDYATYPYCNYNMIPCDVKYYYDKTDKEKYIIFSFITLSKYYHIFIHYQNAELSDEDMTDLCQMIGNKLITQKNVNELREFILTRCFPTFFIDKKYVKEWGCDYLSYNDAIVWFQWFEKYKKCSSDINFKKDNCCECDKYEKLGGDGTFDALKDFLDKIIRFKETEYIPSSFYIPININNSIDDLGVMTPIAEKNDGNINENIDKKTNLISGVTSSKLSIFLNEQILVNDNLGNNFFGTYQKVVVNDEIANENVLCYKEIKKSDENNGEIYTLNLPYQINAVSNVEPFYIDNVVYFWGNIITNIYDENGESIDIDNTNLIEGQKINIEYYIGTLLNRDYSLYKDNGKSYGIKYIDTYTISIKTATYYKNYNDFFDIQYYELIPEYIIYENQDYNVENLKVIKSHFEFYYPLNLNIDFYEPMDEITLNNDIIYNIREEHNIGKSTIEKIDANIYINRGNSRVLDPHLRLLEVKTLESLEETGNGFFNII